MKLADLKDRVFTSYPSAKWSVQPAAPGWGPGVVHVDIQLYGFDTPTLRCHVDSVSDADADGVMDVLHKIHAEQPAKKRSGTGHSGTSGGGGGGDDDVEAHGFVVGDDGGDGDGDD